MICGKDVNELYYLYFEVGYTYSKLIEHFKNRYSYAEIKTAINKVTK